MYVNVRKEIQVKNVFPHFVPHPLLKPKLPQYFNLITLNVFNITFFLIISHFVGN